jgi:hypothetical protein
MSPGAVSHEDAFTSIQSPDAHVVRSVGLEDDHAAFDERRAFRDETG